jgi:peptidoglycan-N-acetylglucosamine deacetylase
MNAAPTAPGGEPVPREALTRRFRPRAGETAGLALLAGFGLALAHAGPGITAVAPLRRLAFPRLAGQGATDHVALTFDDGPDPAWTPQFLDVLDSRGVRATFFLLGSMVARAPGLAADLAAAGHELAVHGWDHRHLPLRTPAATRDDIKRARDIIAEAAGTEPKVYRPPYGVLTTAALATARRLGMTVVLWTCWGHEWARGATPETVFSTLAARLGGGATVLLHDSGAVTPVNPPGALGALPMLLDECAQRGLQVGPVAEHGIVTPAYPFIPPPSVLPGLAPGPRGAPRTD